MNVYLPPTPLIRDAVAVAVMTAVVVVTLRWFTQHLFRGAAAVHLRLLQGAVAIIGALTFIVGWSVVSYPPFANFLGSDASSYHVVISNYVDVLPAVVPPERWVDRVLFIGLLGWVQLLVGNNGFVSVLVNVLLIGTAVALTIDSAVRVLGPVPDRWSASHARAGLATALVVLATPAIPLWGGIPLREALVMLLVALVGNGAVRLVTGGPALQPMLLMLAGTVAMEFTRDVLVPVLLVGVTTAVLMRAVPATWWQRPFQIGRAALPAAAVGATFITLLVTPRLTRAATDVAETTHRMLVNLARRTATAVDPDLTHRTEVTATFLAFELPRGMARYLWGPPPGRLLLTHPLIYVDSLVWIAVTALVVIGVLAARGTTRSALVPLLAMALAGAALGGLTLGNYGIISRLRVGTGMALLPVAGLGLAYLTARWRSAPHRVTTSVPADRASAAGAGHLREVSS